jgi:hypothetical protein
MRFLVFFLQTIWDGLVSMICDVSYGPLKDAEDSVREGIYQDWLSSEKNQLAQNSTLSLPEIDDIVYVLEAFAISFVDLTRCGPDESCLAVYPEDVLHMNPAIERLYEKNQNQELRDYLIKKGITC